jgi:hypothetical protein
MGNVRVVKKHSNLLGGGSFRRGIVQMPNSKQGKFITQIQQV